MAEQLNGTEIHVYRLPGEVGARCLCVVKTNSLLIARGRGAERLNG